MGASTQGEADWLAAWRVELDGSPYEAVRLLGRGGMGAVFEVVHRALGQRRVLKLVAEAGRRDLEDRLRFEAQTLARLEHPNLLKVHDLGTSASGRLYMITELLQGRTLKEELYARGPLPPAEAIAIGIGVLDGLAAAHAAGVIHRDLKPDNIFLTRSKGDAASSSTPFGGVKVIDFGIAKIVSIEGTVAAEMKAVGPLLQPTRTGFLIGTPQVMSPEQLLAKPVDARSDLYALGAVLFRCLTGRLLFVEKEIVDLAKAHVFKVPDAPSAVAPQRIPQALDAIILRALAKSPADRYASANEMARALREVQDAAASAPLTNASSIYASSISASSISAAAPVRDAFDQTATVAFEVEHETFTNVTLPVPMVLSDPALSEPALSDPALSAQVLPDLVNVTSHQQRPQRTKVSLPLAALLFCAIVLTTLVWLRTWLS